MKIRNGVYSMTGNKVARESPSLALAAAFGCPAAMLLVFSFLRPNVVHTLLFALGSYFAALVFIGLIYVNLDGITLAFAVITFCCCGFAVSLTPAMKEQEHE